MIVAVFLVTPEWINISKLRCKERFKTNVLDTCTLTAVH